MWWPLGLRLQTVFDFFITGVGIVVGGSKKMASSLEFDLNPDHFAVVYS